MRLFGSDPTDFRKEFRHAFLALCFQVIFIIFIEYFDYLHSEFFINLFLIFYLLFV